MSDIIDQANDVADIMLTSHLSQRRASKLVPAGTCHYCDELLPKIGQLFCGAECSEDFSREEYLRKLSGKRGD